MSRNLHRGTAGNLCRRRQGARGCARGARPRFRSAGRPGRAHVLLPAAGAFRGPRRPGRSGAFDQRRCASELGERRMGPARSHRDVIRRFGRFPHRNAILGRINTPDEEEYLAEPGAGFGPRDKGGHAMNELADQDHEIGSGEYRYRFRRNWAKPPRWWNFGEVDATGPPQTCVKGAVAANGDVYVLSRAAHPVMVFDAEGRFVSSWGEGEFSQLRAWHDHRSRRACLDHRYGPAHGHAAHTGRHKAAHARQPGRGEPDALWQAVQHADRRGVRLERRRCSCRTATATAGCIVSRPTAS